MRKRRSEAPTSLILYSEWTLMNPVIFEGMKVATVIVCFILSILCHVELKRNPNSVMSEISFALCLLLGVVVVTLSTHLYLKVNLCIPLS
ncbi:hypothetical protein D3C76_37090 [compost metagenome]